MQYPNKAEAALAVAGNQQLDDLNAQLVRRTSELAAELKRRELIERELRDTRDQWEQCFNVLADHICILDLDGKILLANQTMRRRFEPVHGNLVGLDYRLIYCGTATPDPQPPCAAVLSGSGPVQCEAVLPTMTGEYLVSSFPLFNSEGRQWGAVSVVSDISERKRAEKELQERARQQHQLYVLADTMNRAERIEEIYQAALNSILDALHADRASILLYDDDGVMRFKAWRGLSDGYRAAVEGHTPWERDVTDPEPITVTDVREMPLEPGLRRIILGEGIRSLAFIPLVYHGRLLGKFMIYFDAPHVFTDDEVQLARMIGSQIAFAIERKRDEDALREAKEQAEAANKAKDRFLAVLSHELRTPLSPVVMAIAAMEHHPELPFELREDVAMIRRNIDLETKLIDDLLDLSRVISGKLRLRMETVDVHAVLRHVLESCAAEARAKLLCLESELAARSAAVRGDPARIQQVFWNLIKNALKFTPPEGRITVRTTNDRRSRLRVTIADTGVGIAPEVLPRLFDAFEQGNARSTHHQFGGLGLGLTICRAVLDLHGGSIRADSAGEGKGAVFTIELQTVQPVRAGRVASDTGQASVPAGKDGHMRILLVEDHPDSARTLARLLARSGFSVRTADTAASALALAAAERFDVLISDIGLPDATGYQLMEQIRSNAYPIKGIALSGYGMEEDMKRSREAGFAEHVVKPVDVQQLQAVIQRVCTAGG